MVESWNRANAVIFYGKGGDLASNNRDEQAMSHWLDPCTLTALEPKETP